MCGLGCGVWSGVYDCFGWLVDGFYLVLCCFWFGLKYFCSGVVVDWRLLRGGCVPELTPCHYGLVPDSPDQG